MNRPRLRIVASAAEDSAPTLRVRRESTTRLRRLELWWRIRPTIGLSIAGAVFGSVVTLVLHAAGVW